MFEQEIIDEIKKHVKADIELEVPPNPKMGDFAYPCFALAKTKKKSPAEIAKDLASKIKKPAYVKDIKATGPYVNFFLDSEFVGKKVIQRVLEDKSKFGFSKKQKGQVFAIDYSHPNIGKPFHFGHLRSTIIGESVARILEFQGAKVERLNYIGDWGTQFGKLIYAYLEWGKESELKANPVKHLLELYVKFHDKAKTDESLNEEARKWFAKLEQGDEKAIELWGTFRAQNLKEFERVYDILDCEFDSFNGEAYIARQVDEALKIVKKKGAAEIDDGALVAHLDDFEVPLILVKSDGSTTYGSRDVAAAMHRLHDLNATKLLYVVGHEQALHFKQLFSLMDKLGHPKENFIHVSFGFYLGPNGGKLSTRKGEVVLMDSVLNEAIGLALRTIEEKNPSLKSKEEVARLVGVGAIKFGDLASDRVKDHVYDLQKILSFEGDTGPYLIYTHARAASVVRKAKEKAIGVSKVCNTALIQEASEQKLIKKILEFPKRVDDAASHYKPHLLAQYLLEFAHDFNEFYHACPVLKEENKDLAQLRVTLVEISRQVLENGLNLLGIAALHEM